MLKFSRGFTLIELMVGLAILAIVISVGMPNLSQWVGNMKIRTTAEALQSGLALARTEALKRNTTMRFQLTNTIGGDCALSESGPNWVVSRDSAEDKCDAAPDTRENTDEPCLTPCLIQTYDGREGGEGRTLISAEQSSFTFNSQGRLVRDSSPGSISVWDAKGERECVSKDGNGKARCLKIEVGLGGGIRMCDPALPSTDMQACG
jgi:type IV fimbrial biogenesis protein FimT